MPAVKVSEESQIVSGEGDYETVVLPETELPVKPARDIKVPPKKEVKTALKPMAQPLAQVTAPQPVPAPKVVRAELPPVLKMNDFKIAEYAVATFNVWLPVGWKFAETLRPEFWAQVAHQLHKQKVTNEPDRSGATIQVRTRDHNFYAELYVTSVLEHSLNVQVLREPVYFDLQEIPQDDQYRAQWNGAKNGWDIIRKSDGAVCGDGANIKRRKDAQQWIERMK